MENNIEQEPRLKKNHPLHKCPMYDIISLDIKIIFNKIIFFNDYLIHL